MYVSLSGWASLSACVLCSYSVCARTPSVWAAPASMRACLHTVHLCMHVCLCKRMSARVFVYMHVRVFVYTCVNVCVRVCMCIRMSMSMCPCVQLHVLARVCLHMCLCLLLAGKKPSKQGEGYSCEIVLDIAVPHTGSEGGQHHVQDGNAVLIDLPTLSPLLVFP